jgi:hypothetical protein
MAIICPDYKILFIQVPATGCTSISKVLIENFGGHILPEKDILLGGKYKLVGIKHNTVAQLVGFNLISKKELNSYLTFATVRNPFDRYATAYQRLVGPWWEKVVQSDHPNTPANRSGKVNRKRYVKKIQQEMDLARGGNFEQWLTRKIIVPQQLDQRLVRGLKSLYKKDALLLSNKSFKMNIAYPMIHGVDEVIRYEHLERDFNNILRKVGITEYISVPHTNKTPGKQSYRDHYTPKARAIIEEELGEELALFGYTFDSREISSNHQNVVRANNIYIS